VELRSDSDRWSEQFEICASVDVIQSLPFTSVQVCDRNSTSLVIPIQSSSSSGFWQEELVLRNLWPLEEVRFLLINGQENHSFAKQANSSGVLSINLASFRDVLPESDWYNLSFQRQGEDLRKLLEVFVKTLVDCTLTQEKLHLSGLMLGHSHTVSLWNILQPTEPALQSSFKADQESYLLSLQEAFPNAFGIFFIQIESSYLSPHSLGWWSNIKEMNCLIIPESLDENYCFNILGNESFEGFEELSRDIDFSINCEQIKRAVTSLKKVENYLPDLLDRDLLIRKLKAIISENPGNESSLSPMFVSYAPGKFTYQLEIQKNTSEVRAAFYQGFTNRLNKSGLGRQSIQLIDPNSTVKDLIGIRLEDQKYLIKLQEILSDIESTLHTSIELKSWGQGWT
jgi:hypothetical protein